MKAHTFTLLLLSTALLITGCKKEEETPKLVKSIEQYGDTTTYEYNENAQLVKTSSTYGNIDTYTYGTNTVNVKYIIPYTNGGGERNAVIDLRNDGKIERYTDDNQSTSYNYNSDGLLQTTVSNLDTTIFEWLNGNIVKETMKNTSGISVLSYTHYTDKENTLSGKYTGTTWGPRSQNLLKSRTVTYNGTADVYDYTYIFDNEGRVATRLVKINGTDSPNSTLEVTYY